MKRLVNLTITVASAVAAAVVAYRFKTRQLWDRNR